MSVIYSPINMVMFYGVAIETLLFLLIIYVPGVNKVFGARPVDILNLGYNVISISIECLDCLSVFAFSAGRSLASIASETFALLKKECPTGSRKTSYGDQFS
jgi:hypothetical protein